MDCCYQQSTLYVRTYSVIKKMGNNVMKSLSANLELERTEDILAFLGANKQAGQFICGFSMETENMLENSRAKLERKNVDMIVANNLKVAGAGFGTDTNVVTFITKEECVEHELMSKAEVAGTIVDFILTKMIMPI